MNLFNPAIRIVITTAMIVSATTGEIYSQDCALKLQEAEETFDRGRVELVSDLLTPCLNSGGFSREEALTAYKLLIQSLYMDEKTSQAEEIMIEFMRKYPEYEVTAADYSGFVYLRNKYDVKSLFLISARFGLNYTYLSGQSEQSLSSLEPDISYSREPFNLYAGAEALLPVARKLSVAAGINYSVASFRYTENMLNFGTVEYQESQKRIEVPISVIYQFASYHGIVAYGRAGAGYAFNINTDSKASFKPADINNAYIRTGENVNRNDSRIKYDLFLHAALGGMLKIPRGYITAEVRTLMGIRNQVIRSDAGNLEYYYFYTDDNFRLNIAGITVGYTYIFYKPSKKLSGL